jgi:ring-1,2-phenylacetyl-CoA epoxidase subunit PaaC
VADEVDAAMAAAGIAPDLAALKLAWDAKIDPLLTEAALSRPKDTPYAWFGKQGAHSEHLGYLLAEMQHMQRTYPGASW